MKQCQYSVKWQKCSALLTNF